VSALDGYNRVVVPYARDDDIVAEAAAAGADVLVLEPAELRRRVLERLAWVAQAGSRAERAESDHGADAEGAPGRGRESPGRGRPKGRGGRGPSRRRPPVQPKAAEQVARLLLLIPYLQAHQGVALDDVARTFGVTPEEVRSDLAVAFMCGLPGGLPGDLIYVDLDLVDDEGVVYLTNADVLNRPLTLDPDEAMGLAVALQAVREVASAGIRAVVDSLMAKLAALLPAAVEAPHVRVAAGDAAVRDALFGAISRAERVELTYGGVARGQTTRPVVDPVRLTMSDGVGYLSAWSVTRADWRTYRLDRIASVRPTGDLAAGHGPEPEPGSWLSTLAAASPVRLLVRPGARWIAEHYPLTEQVELPNGDAEVTLPVADPTWLRWLLLRLGPDAEVVDAPAIAADAALAAQTALDAYSAAGLTD
jgi:proteasome accessory factor C